MSSDPSPDTRNTLPMEKGSFRFRPAQNPFWVQPPERLSQIEIVVARGKQTVDIHFYDFGGREVFDIVQVVIFFFFFFFFLDIS